MAYQAIPPVSGGSSLTASLALNRARSLLGSSIKVCLGTDFESSAWYVTSVTGTGAVTISTTTDGGVATATSGATGGGVAQIHAAGNPSHVSNMTTKRWYHQARMKVTTAIDASAYVAVALNPAAFGGVNCSSYMGTLGNVSTANFAYELFNTSGVSITTGSLGVAVDTAYHLFEQWSDTTNIRMAVDGVTTVTIAVPGSFTGPTALATYCTNGATAAARTMDIDRMFVCTEEP